ncbi:hypothetical protein D7Z94_25235 [Ulvibacterium marinum]|uniref:Uncharacterized protein n=2 Tax=Ulvibacterium marinum TaxID=2419782 RepID=A0A3B0BSW4_9FLAO|nr:hypothetical protein D7Z94_25235 [Ulvibacterium marinum]
MFFLLPLILPTALVCCNKDDEAEKFYWEQTKCSDPWGTGERDANPITIQALEQYLEDNDIEALRIMFDNKSALDALCESCGCGTGQRIIVTVPKSDETELQDLGFIKV